MNARWTAAFAAAVLAACAQAEDKVYLLKSDSDNTGSFATANWSNNAVPDGEHDYIVSKALGGFELRASISETSSFAGRSLQIGDGTAAGKGMLLFRTVYRDTDVTFGNDGLILSSGSIGTYNTYGFTAHASVRVESSMGAPFEFFGTGIGAWCRFDGAFSGGTNAHIWVFTRMGDGKNDDFACHFAENTLEGYFGRITVAGRQSGYAAISYVHATAAFGGGSFPGTLVLSPYTFLRLDSAVADLAVSNVTFAANAGIRVAFDMTEDVCSLVRVLGTYSQEGTVTIYPYSATSWATALKTGGIHRWPILKAPEGVALDESSFVLDGMFPASPSFALEVAMDADDGRSTLYLAQTHEMDWTTAADGSGAAAGSFVKAGYWYGGCAPVREKDYFAAFQMRTPSLTEDCEFTGHSLSFADGGHIITRVPGLTIDDLRILSGTNTFEPYGSGGTVTPRFADTTRSNCKIDGRIRIAKDAAFRLLTERYISYEINAEISGSGTVVADTYYVSSGENTATIGNVGLFGLNTNFFGKVCVTMYKNGGTLPAASHLYIRDKRNLGAPLPYYTYDALRLNDKYSSLHPLADIVLDDSTRGICLKGKCIIDVTNDVTFTVKENIHYWGHVRKWGAGTLELGSAPKYRESDPSPRTGENVLEVEAGAIRPLTHLAVQGLAVIMTNANAVLSLNVPSDNTDGGIGQYGMLNSKWSSPFTLPAEGLKPVLRDTSGAVRPPAMGHFVPICTVTAAAESLDGKFLAPESPYPHCKCLIDKEANADGTVTFIVRFKSAGMTVIVR